MSSYLSIRTPPSFSTALQPFLAYARTNSTLLTLLMAPPVLHALYTDYAHYISLGPGRFPSNPIGWAVSCICSLFLARGAGATSGSTAAAAATGFLRSELPTRLGYDHYDAPPQRDVADALDSAILEIHADYARTTELRHGRAGIALFVHPAAVASVPRELAAREIVHVHGGSLHVVLAARDGREVVRKGWGERQPCADGVLPELYLMVYAPRDWEEVSVVRRIVDAGVRFAVGMGDGGVGRRAE